MWMHLLKYELKKSIADGFLWIQTIMILAFSFIAISVGYDWYKFNSQTIEKIKQTEQEQLAVFKRDAKNYENNNDSIKVASPNHPVTVYYAKRGYTFKMPMPISIFNIGQSDIYSNYGVFTGVEPQKLITEGELINPLNQLIGKIDFSFFVIYILPLLIIAWTFDLFSNEKELGTLRLLYMQQIRVENVVVGKLIFRFIYLVLLLAGIVCIGFLAIKEFDINSLQSILLYFLVVIIYVTFWFSLAFIVNSLGKNSAFNGMVLIGVWVIFLFLIPSVLNVFVNRAHSLPERKQHIVEERLYKNSIDKEKALSNFFKTHPKYQKDLNSKSSIKYVVEVDWYLEYLATQWGLNQLRRQQDKEIFQCLNKQHKLIGNFLFLSPALICQTTMNQLAKTDFNSFYEFFEDERKYRENWQYKVYEKLFGWNYFKAKDFDAFSSFYPIPGMINLNFGFRFSILFSFVILFFAVGFTNFKKFTFQWL